MSTVDTGISSTEARFGGSQRRITFVNQRWYVIYLDGVHVYYKKSTDTTGTSWGTRVQVSNVADSFNPSIWVDGNLIWITWFESSTDVSKYRSLDTSNDSLGTIAVTPDSGGYGNADYTSIFVDGSAKYIYHSDDPVIYKTTNDTSFADITPSGALSDNPTQFAKSGSNIWSVSGPSVFDSTVRVSPYNGTSWGSVTTVETSIDQDYTSSLSVTSKGNNIYVSFNNAGTIKVVKYDGTNWFTLTPNVATGAPTASTDTAGTQATSISVDSNTEDIYVFYRKASDSKIYYKKSTDADLATSGSPGVIWGSETDTGLPAGSIWISTPYSNTERLGIMGNDGTNLSFLDLGALVAGATVGYGDRSFRLALEGVDYLDRNFRLKATDTGYEDRSFRLVVHATDFEDRNFRLKADTQSFEDRNFRLVMSEEGFEDRSFHVKATDIDYEDRTIHLTLEETDYEDRSFYLALAGLQDGFADRNFRLTLRDTAFEDRSVIIKVSEIAYEDRNFRLVLEETGFGDRNFRLYLAQNQFEDRSIRTFVEEIQYADRNFRFGVFEIPGTFPTHEDRGFVLRFESDQWVDKPDKVTTFTNQADKTTIWTDVTDKSTDWT